MSNEFVANLLQSWGMTDLIEKFESEGIDEDAFTDLDENSVKELIPKLGLRIKFWKKYHQFKKPNEEESPPTSEADTVSVGSDSSGLSLPPAVTLVRSHQNLTQVLKDNVMGKEILAAYESSKALNNHLRSKLAEIIVNSEFRRSTDNQISTDRFMQLRDEIKELFPTENKETYYIPYAKVGNTISQAKGKLWSKYYNTRRSLRSVGVIHRVAQDDPTRAVESASDYIPSDDEREKVVWLKNSQEPWNLVVEYWQYTCKSRIIEFQNSISDYFGLFPVLKQNQGYTLLEIDFADKYPGKELHLFSNWPTYCKKILAYARHSNKSIYKNYLDVLSVNDTDEIQSIVALRLLPLLLPVITVQTKKKTCWRPSKVEVQEGFVTRINDVSDLQPSIERRAQKMQKYGLTLQPMVTIVAASLQKVEACYVTINDTTYHLDTPLKAVDICFKAIHALDALYPIQSEQVWLFIERAIFDIPTPSSRNKRLPVGLTSLLHDLKEV